jgi:hypothetical protein
MLRTDCEIVVEAVGEAQRILRLHAALRARRNNDTLIDELFQTLDCTEIREALARLEARNQFGPVQDGADRPMAPSASVASIRRRNRK